jgi:tripartite-type tricarboxylate transporter receptor subunit TctC
MKNVIDARLARVFITGLLMFFYVFVVGASAEDAKDFYKGKRMTLLVQYSPGGSFDVQARWLARQLPGLTDARTIVRNMPGGGGVTGYNRLYRLPPNGLTLLTTHTKLIAFDLFGRKGVKYDFAKFNYLGRVVRTNTALLVSKNLPTDINELRKLKRIRVGASSPFFEGLVAEMLGLPITIVPGYGGSSERMAAIMRGELDATMASVAGGLKFAKAVNIVLTFRKDPRTPNVPDLKEAKAKQPWRRYATSFNRIQGAVITSPGVPTAKTKFLTKVLKKVTKDEKALKEAKKLKFVVSWTGPKKLEKSVEPFTALTAEEKKTLKFIIEQKYVGKLRN